MKTMAPSSVDPENIDLSENKELFVDGDKQRDYFLLVANIYRQFLRYKQLDDEYPTCGPGNSA